MALESKKSKLEFESLSLKDFLNAFYKEYADFRPDNKQEFKDKVESYLQRYKENENQNESTIVTNTLKRFFENLEFKASTEKQKGSSDIDLALKKNGNVEILIEAKKPDNTAEMFSQNKPNCKALHQCILYYLRERKNGLNANTNIQFIIITDFYQFYIFSAGEFKRYFYDNSKIEKLYKNLEAKQNLNIKTQEDFYKELKDILDEYFMGNREGDLSNFKLKGLYFDLRNDKHLNTAHKILTREFLHKEYKPDPTALNPRFYKELLYILGLKEFDRGGKITIELDNTQEKSFAKHIASKLGFKNLANDFESVMAHILIWLNRILFLKLIEANLLHFNNFDKNLRFLSSDKIKSFDDLNHLFFEVLALDYEDSNKDQKYKRGSDKGFNFLPYLNSSLFARDKLETLEIKDLSSDLEIQIFKSTQTDKKGETCKFLTYLLDFLNAFDFGKKQEDLEDSTQEISHKILIHSSVLGAMFEKLNGYKEGSFYTKNFITSYMCKESLQKVVIEKFNNAKGWDCKNLESLKKKLDKLTEHQNGYKEANAIFDSIKICDPTVGSGYFLASALNELILLKFQLGILCYEEDEKNKDKDRERIKNIKLEILHDEIAIRDSNDTPFTYTRPAHDNIESHKIQRALFHNKRTLIESCLFGVDINPNSCNIARLRLWIELLKSAYYLNFTKDKNSKIHKLQTLPNVDINIKEGNSLVSRFALNSKISKSLEQQVENYKKYVKWYQEPKDYKKEIEAELMELKTQGQEFKNTKEMIEHQIENINKSFIYCLKDIKTHNKLVSKINEHFKNFGYSPEKKDDWNEIISGLIGIQLSLSMSEEEKKGFASFGEIQGLEAKLKYNESGAKYKTLLNGGLHSLRY